MKNHLLENLRTLKVNDEKILEEYVNYCLNNSNPSNIGTHKHHILPSRIFVTTKI